MAATITIPFNAGGAPSAPTFSIKVNAVLDNSYPTGGYALDFATVLPGKTIGAVVARGIVTSSGNPDAGRQYHYNATTKKLMAFTVTTAPAEVSAAVDLSTITVELAVQAQ